jgi:hypothetical protein
MAKGIMDIMMRNVLPVVGSLYAARFITGLILGKQAAAPDAPPSPEKTEGIPGLDKLPPQFVQPVVAAGLMVAGHFATMKGPQILKKHRLGIMTGLGINLVDKIFGAFAPVSVKEMVGVSSGLSDYVSVDDYIAIGNVPPIQDDITLAEYVAIGQYEGEGLEEDLGEMYQDLGEMYQDLGVEMDLGNDLPPGGGFANRHLGGVHRNQMLAPVPRKRYTAPVPARSFTKPVPQIGDGFDKPNKLYTGIFGGGF